MKNRATLVLAALSFACAPSIHVRGRASTQTTPNQGQRDDAFDAALDSVVASGATVSVADRKTGIIQTAPKRTVQGAVSGLACLPFTILDGIEWRQISFVVRAVDHAITIEPRVEACSHSGCKASPDLSDEEAGLLASIQGSDVAQVTRSSGT